jgi:hypothetical protein
LLMILFIPTQKTAGQSTHNTTCSRRLYSPLMCLSPSQKLRSHTREPTLILTMSSILLMHILIYHKRANTPLPTIRFQPPIRMSNTLTPILIRNNIQLSLLRFLLWHTIRMFYSLLRCSLRGWPCGSGVDWSLPLRRAGR